MCVACLGLQTRRGVLTGLVTIGISGCSENAATGPRQLVVVDDRQLVVLADQAWAEITAKVGVVRDRAAQARLARIGRRLAAVSGRADLDWSFTVFDSPDLNAFVLPNGKVGFYRGLLELAADDDEIGSVLGHEVGHVIARHAAERLSHELAVKAGLSVAKRLIAEDAGQFTDEIGAALGVGATVGVILPFSRKHELEADQIGVSLMKTAGMDPSAAVRFWTRMAQRSKAASQPIEVVSTHPADSRRLEALKAAVATLG